MNQSQYGSALKLGSGYSIAGSERGANKYEMDSAFEHVISTSRTEPTRVIKPVSHEMGVGND